MTATVKLLIDQRLEEVGKTAYWLAKETAIDHATLSQIRKNENKSINREFFARICMALECQPGDLIKLIAEPAKKARKKGSD